MLINAQRPEELRIAIIHGNTLESYKVDVAESGVTRGNIYRGTIANIQPSLNAAFIEYGAERHGFLAIQDVVPEAYYREPKGGHPRIEDVLEKGKPIVVQVAKDPMGQKGAALTTGLSLAGRYLVLTPFDSTRGVSRKVEDEDTRKKLKTIAHGFELPDGCGVILRTNALEQTKATLAKDLSALLRLWKRVQTAAVTGKGSRLLYTDQDLILQALRDYLDSSIEEVLIDDDEAFMKAEAYMQAFMPRSKTQLTRYADRLPLFSRYDIEPQIERIFERRVELPSGGSIVIDATEALTAIDVNSGRSTRAATQEETALHTNLEAADEVARQLRLRDIGGLVVVDFIDMRAAKGQRKVEKTLKDALKVDKARTTVGRISPNGLLEINRQRIQQAIQLRTHRPCPTCAGVGRLASEEMVTLNLLRRIEARAASGAIQGVRIRLHPELADAMQNSRRREMAALEEEFEISIEIIAAPGLHRPEEQIEWARREGPPPKPRPQKPALPTLRPWDLALPEPEEEEEEEEQDEAPAGRRATAQQAGPPGESAADAKRRKRRRGGRKRKKGGVGANGAEGATGHEVHEDHEGDEPFLVEAAGDEALAAPPFYEPEGDDDGDEGDDFEPAEGEAGAAGSEGSAAGGTGPARRGRGRRRRRRGGGGGGSKAQGGGEG
jgi:ribonuclease E